MEQRVLELMAAVNEKLTENDTRVAQEEAHYPDCCGPTLARSDRMFLQYADMVLPKFLAQLRRDSLCVSNKDLVKYLGKVHSAVGHCRPIQTPSTPMTWILDHPGCMEFDAWSGLAKDICNLTYDLDFLEQDFKNCLNCELEFSLALPAIQQAINACNIEFRLQVDPIECEVEYNLYSKILESADCSLSFETYLQLRSCGITYKILTDLAACGVYMTYNVQESCPEITYGLNQISLCALDPTSVKLSS